MPSGDNPKWRDTQTHHSGLFIKQYQEAVAAERCPERLAETGWPRENVRAYLRALRRGAYPWAGNLRAVWERSGVL